jgi:hypothetical protein
MGMFTIDDITGKRDYKPEDLWEGILVMRDWELRNRGNNSKKVKV